MSVAVGARWAALQHHVRFAGQHGEVGGVEMQHVRVAVVTGPVDDSVKA